MQTDKREDGKKAVRNQTQISGCINEHTVVLATQRGNQRDTSLKRKLAQLKVWKILKEMGIPDHLTCLLRNLYAGQEATVRTGHGTTDWFQIRKGVRQGCILSPTYLTYMQSTS